MKTRFSKALPALLAALCLALAGCGEALGSEPVVVSDNSPSYVDGVSSAPGKDFAALAGAATTEAGTVYLDVTDEMYATGRYGEKPDGAGCISAAQAADLAAQYAACFADYGLDNGLWKLNVAVEDTFRSGQPVWSCTLSLPKWSEDPDAIPDVPVWRSLGQHELAVLDEGTPNRIELTLDAATGKLLSGWRWMPCDLSDLVNECDYPQEKAQALADDIAAWYESGEPQEQCRGFFSPLTGTELSRIEREPHSPNFYEAYNADGERYLISPQYATGKLYRFQLLP